MLSLADIASRALEHTEDRLPTIDQLLEALVRIPSPSGDLEGNRRCLEVMAGGFAALGFLAEVLGAEEGREHLLCSRDGQPGAPTVLLLGHTDTPFGRDDGFQGFWTEGARARGPGVATAKGGLVVMLTVLDTLAELQLLDAFHLRALLTTDAEGLSRTSATLVRDLAERAQLALVFEPARDDGALITARRAAGHFEIEVTGRPSHAASAHAEGRNAILELAYKVPKLDGLTNPRRGVTVNCGVIAGGTRSNVVAERAHLEIDARCESAADARWVEQRLREVAADVMVRGCTTKVSGGFHRPAWPPTAATQRLVEIWQRAARALALDELPAGPAGDGGDANHAHEGGAPTLDGLGPVGGASHTAEEWADLGSFTRRAALSATALALWRAKLAKEHGATPFGNPPAAGRPQRAAAGASARPDAGRPDDGLGASLYDVDFAEEDLP